MIFHNDTKTAELEKLAESRGWVTIRDGNRDLRGKIIKEKVFIIKDYRFIVPLNKDTIIEFRNIKIKRDIEQGAYCIKRADGPYLYHRDLNTESFNKFDEILGQPLLPFVEVVSK